MADANEAELHGAIARGFGISPDLVSRAQLIKKQSLELFEAVFLGFLTIDQAERVIESLESKKPRRS